MTPKNVCVSTHNFEKHGCWSTHGIHTNETPVILTDFISELRLVSPEANENQILKKN